MNNYNIAFPNFDIYLNINKIAFSIGNISIHWYGIIIAFAVLLCLFLAYKNNNKYVCFAYFCFIS